MSADGKVHQGDQIDGGITVITTEKTKIVIDFGENLPGAEKESNIEFNLGRRKGGCRFLYSLSWRPYR